MADWLEHIANEEILKQNLIFCSLYIAVYEHITDCVEDAIKSFLCHEQIEDGKLTYAETSEYRKKIKNRIVDDKGNKNITKASFLWLVENGAISEEDYRCFLQAKDIRNRYAHELFRMVCEGVPEEDVKHFFNFYAVYNKIVKWHYINIDAEIMGYEVPSDADEMEVYSMASALFKIILDVLYLDKSDEYSEIIEKLKQKGPTEL